MLEEACPGFGQLWNEGNEDCKACKDEYPDEYERCKKVVLGKRELKAEPKIEPEIPEEDDYSTKRKALAGAIVKGGTLDEMVDFVQEHFPESKRRYTRQIVRETTLLLERLKVGRFDSDMFVFLGGKR